MAWMSSPPFAVFDRRRLLQFITVVAVLLMALPAAARTNLRFCFPQTAWFGGGPPTIDGNAFNNGTIMDSGWRGAFRYIFDNATNGTPYSNIEMHGIRDANALYLGFEVHKTVAFNDDDMIILTFDPTGNPADMRRLNIFPVTTGQGTAANQPPRQIQYWQDQSTWNNSSGPTPSWLTPIDTQTNLRLSTVATATDFGYSLELKIPTTGPDAFPLPANGDFGLYVNVMRTVQVQPSAEIAEDSWPPPPDTQLVGGIYTNTPDPSTWGNGSLSGSTCNGVSIANTDIKANGGTTLQFPPGSNTFTVNVHNDTVNEAGEPVLAPQIQPTFFLGDFGITLVPIQIPVGNNPPPPQDIPPSNSVAFQTAAWTLTPTQVTTYTNTPHQCVMVSLDSKAPSTNPPCNQNPPPPECLRAQILNDVAVQNMNFDVVEQGMNKRGFIAAIPTKLWKPPAGRNYQLVDLHIRTQPVLLRERQVVPMATGGGGATPPDLLFTVNGYRHIDKFVTVNRHKYEIVERMGAFGYGMHFAGQQAPEWRYQFFGEDGTRLKQPSKDQNVYQLRIPQGQVGHVNVVFEGDKSAPIGGPTHSKGGGGGERG